MIDQPSSAPTSEEIAKALENARNNVSILEAESVRLDRLIGSQKRELVAQEGAKRDIDDLIVIAEGKLAILDAQIESQEKSLSLLEAEAESKKTELVAREEAVEKTEEVIKQKEADLLSREAILESSEELLIQKEVEFNMVKNRQLEAVEKIKTAIQSL